MTQDERAALRVAKQCIQKEIKAIAVAANLEDMYDAHLPFTEAASRRRERLEKALVEIERMMNG